MTTSLERRYRRLLWAYPAAYRRRGDELLATLLEAGAPGQRHPTLRETLALLGGGLSARAGLAGGCAPWTLWAEGLRLGALLLLVSMTGDAASATWLQANHLVFTWIFSNAAGLVVTLASAGAVAAVARGAFRAMVAGHAAHPGGRAVRAPFPHRPLPPPVRHDPGHPDAAASGGAAGGRAGVAADRPTPGHRGRGLHELVMGDADGVVVVPAPAVQESLDQADARVTAEQRALDAIRAGATTLDYYHLPTGSDPAEARA